MLRYDRTSVSRTRFTKTPRQVELSNQEVCSSQLQEKCREKASALI